jgi:gas vesicle protein
MSDDNGGSKLAFFLAGAGIGAILALLFAPKSGRETRDFLTQKAGEGRDYLTTKSRELREQAEDLVDKGKERLTKQKEKVAAAYEAGRQAYHEEKSKG